MSFSPFIDRLGLDWDANDPDDIAVANALDQALSDLTSYIAAAGYVDCDAAVIEGWDDLMFERLLGALDKEQMARAVLALVIPYATSQADGLVNQFRDLREVTP